MTETTTDTTTEGPIGSGAPITTTTSIPTWKGKKGEFAIADMATAHIKNAIGVVESEISKGVNTAAHVLEHLKTELSGRSDA